MQSRVQIATKMVAFALAHTWRRERRQQSACAQEEARLELMRLFALAQMAAQVAKMRQAVMEALVLARVSAMELLALAQVAALVAVMIAAFALESMELM
jgi:hypothetical protein